MRYSLRFYAIVTSLICLSITLLIVWLLPTRRPSLINVDAAIIDEAMTDVEAFRFSQEGHLVQALRMDGWQRCYGETITTMTKPSLKVYNPDSVWLIQALNGSGHQQSLKGPMDKIHLSKQVVIEQLTGPAQQAWALQTEQLDFFPEQKLAFTEAPVMIKSHSMLIQAPGVKGDLNHHKIELLSNVKSHYVKPKL